MFKRFFRAFAAGFLIVGLAAGCASTNTVKSASLDSGRSQTFPATYDRTNAATLTALQSMNISITSSNEDARGTTYLVSKSANLMSWGEVGRIVVARSETDSTTVYVNWEKRSQMQITGTSEGEFSGQLFSQISVRL